MASGSGSLSSSNEQQHRSSQVARAHPLYPLLQNIAQSIKQSHKAIEVVDARTRKIERDYAAINVQLQELLSAIKEQNKRQFNLKSAGFESHLRNEVANSMCNSISRDVEDVHLQRIVKKVLKNEALEKYKFDASIKFLKHTLSVFKTEERRRVYGIPPCQKHASMSTPQLAESIMNYMKASDDRITIYKKHLALLRKYTREKPDARDQKAFYRLFKDWVIVKYPPKGEPSVDEWKLILAEDTDTTYCNTGVSSGTVETEILEEGIVQHEIDDEFCDLYSDGLEVQSGESLELD